MEIPHAPSLVNLPEIPAIGFVEPSPTQVEVAQRATRGDDPLRELRPNVPHGLALPMPVHRHDVLDTINGGSERGQIDSLRLDVDDICATADLGRQFFDRSEEADPAF